MRDVFPLWKSGGIITAITSIEGYITPWAADAAAILLDIQYYGNHSGGKFISPLVDSFVDYTTEPPTLATEDIDVLATVIKNLYAKNWERLWDRFTTVYDPLVNYDVTEELTKTDTNTGTVTDAGSVQHGEVVTTVTDVEATGEGNIFGFNSATAVPSDTTVATNDATETATHSGTDTNGNTTTNNLTNATDSTFRRYGDMSVRSTQDILNGEFQLWQTKFFDIVFADLDTVLTIAVY